MFLHKYKIIVYISLLGGILFFCRDVYASKWEVETKYGSINYNDLELRVKGIAPVLRRNQDEEIRLRIAKADAYRKAIKLVEHIQVNSEYTVEHIMKKDELVKISIFKLFRAMKKYGNHITLPDGTLEQLYVIEMRGSFIDIVLDYIRPVVPPLYENFGNNQELITGLIVDARGLDINAAISQKIRDEDGVEVYGIGYADRKCVSKKGLFLYTDTIEKAIASARVSDTPIIVKGLKGTGRQKSNIVISNSDADKIRASEKSREFIKNCKAVIVL